MLYCEAKLHRAGLANRLFPWARCCIYAHEHGIPMLSPTWVQVPIGTLLRREKDLRTYTNLFAPRAGEISGLRRRLVRLTARRIPEPPTLSSAIAPASGTQLIVFEGMTGQLEPLEGRHDLVRRELISMTRPIWRQQAEAIAGPFIGLHVRCGDFQRPAPGTDFAITDNMSTPIEWFVATLKAVRARLTSPLFAIVTSDGRPGELCALLDLDNVRLVEGGSAISDLLLLSRAKVLLASGSSFSAWASYLGQMPTLTHPGQSLSRLFRLQGTSDHFVGEVEPEKLPRALEDCLARVR